MIGRWMGKACSQAGVPLALFALIGLASLAIQTTTGVRPLNQSYQVEPTRPWVSHSVTHETPTASSLIGKVPMFFEENQGQTAPEVKYLARGSGYNLYLTSDAAVLTVHHSRKKETSTVRMQLVGANADSVVNGLDQLEGKSNYFIGNEPAKWQRDVAQFARVQYQEVYPGINLVYYGNQGSLEYDFEVQPGADPRQVELSFDGAEAVGISHAGDLVLRLADGSIQFHAPVLYQSVNGVKRSVSGSFELAGKNRVRFAVGDYDPRRALVIDPLLTYSTYLGGGRDEACSVILGTNVPVSGCPAVAVDAALNMYLVGVTDSTDFPPQPGVLGSLKGTANIFVTKFNSAGNTLLFSTYIGGNGIDYSAGVAVDAGFDIFVSGTTTSTNFPTSSNAFQTTPISTNKHVFVTELDPTGHTLLYSTYLSGNGVDTASGIALDPSSNAYVTGTTTSTEVDTGFPSTLGSYSGSSRPSGTSQFFVTKINPTLSGESSIAYSTYFGGTNPRTGRTLGGGIAVDSSANVYITGGTDYTDFPISNAFQGTLNAGLDAFLAKLSPDSNTGTQLIYSTYIGGSGDDIGYGVAVDTSLNAYITGSTTSTDFPAGGTGVFQSNHSPAAGNDAFLAKFGIPCTGTGCVNTDVPLSYMTYLGGAGEDVGLAVTVDNANSPTNNNQGARIAGWTNSTDFPIQNTPVQSGFGGGASDAFVARIDTTATSPIAPGHYTTYLGGGGSDYGTGIASDTQGSSYVAGETSSSDFPTATPYRLALDGSTDAFLSKLGPLVAFNLDVSASPTPVGVGSQVTFIYTITNNGDFTSGITFTDTLQGGNGASFVSATANTGTNACGQPNGGTILCNIGTLNAGATATVTVILTPTAPTPPAKNSVNLGNSGFVGIGGSSLATASASVSVNDFDISVSPASATVPAGVPASYTATITPTGSIPASVSLSCSSGLPNGATCSETTNPIPNLQTGQASTGLIINTTARVTTTTEWWHGGRPLYATWFPVTGLALFGAGLGTGSRKRKALMALLLIGFFSLIFFQAGCGGKSSTTTVTGTPAGTYIVTVSATSGASSGAVRSTTVTLVVQ